MNAPTDTAVLATPTQTPANAVAGFGNSASFDLVQRGAKLLAASDLVPAQYRNKIANCTIALELAQRMGASPLLVMQNLYMVHGSPAWSGQFVIASINHTRRFSALRYEFVGEPGTDEWGCRAWAVERDTNERLDGPLITIKMAKAEGWYKNAKWQNLPELMMRYRAGAWWGRTYAPEVTMGLQTVEEANDVIDITPNATSGLQSLADAPDVPDGSIEDTPSLPPVASKPKPAKPKPKQEKAPDTAPAVTFAQIEEALRKASGPQELANAAATIDMLDDEQQRIELHDLALDLARTAA